MLLEEIGHHIPVVLYGFKVADGLEDLEVPHGVSIHEHDRSLVATPVAVVGHGPHSDQGVIKNPLVPFLHELVRPRYDLEAVQLVELVVM